MSESEPEDESRDGSDRRGFLKKITVALGAAVGASLLYPLVRYVLFPVGRSTVDSSDEPIEAIAVDELPQDGKPVKVELVGDGVSNAWATSSGVTLGAAWIRKAENGEVEALSSVCPHLGCAIDFDPEAAEYRCPCHRSAFAITGEKKSGPAKRGLDPLPVEVEGGRVSIRFVRYRTDVAEREPV